jgi:hypothetical protein
MLVGVGLLSLSLSLSFGVRSMFLFFVALILCDGVTVCFVIRARWLLPVIRRCASFLFLLLLLSA